MYSTKSCPKGTVSRKSYRKKSGVKVKSACVKSTSLRSRGVMPKRVLPKLKTGSLTKYGYHIHDTKSIRHKALKKALKAYGFATLIRKLNAVRVLSRNTAPLNSKKYTDDIKYIEKMVNASPKRKSKRRSSKRKSKRRSSKRKSKKRSSKRKSKKRSSKRKSKKSRRSL
jgi:hypothetical protein